MKSTLQIQSSRPEVFLRKSVLKICRKFTGERPCQSAISIKLQSNFIEIALWHGCFPVNLLHIFRTSSLKNTSGWLLLTIEVKSNSILIFKLLKKCINDKIQDLEWTDFFSFCSFFKDEYIIKEILHGLLSNIKSFHPRWDNIRPWFALLSILTSSESVQKQPPRGVLKKRCSKNMQEIYRKTPIQKRDLNTVAKQLYWNPTSAWVFSCKFTAYFQNIFS